MKIDIDNEKKIFTIQREFNNVFPDVMLEFYQKLNTHIGSTHKLVRSRNKSLAECRAINKSGTITIKDGMTVDELKHAFKHDYELSIELFKYKTFLTEDRKPLQGDVVLSTLNK